jgi:type IX secretion system PorP/SprF family membrane protein
MKRKIVLLIVLTGAIVLNSYSQQLPHFRNSYFNLQVMNPATISAQEIPDIILNHRSQWVGFQGAPRMSTLAGKYSFRDDMSAGAYMMSDTYGLTQKLDFCVNYAYLLKSDQFNISFGLAWTLTQYKLMGTEITIYDANDQSINTSLDDKTWKPDANAGLFIYNNKFYAGISVLQLFKTKYNFFQSTNDVPGLIQDVRHFTVAGGI